MRGFVTRCSRALLLVAALTALVAANAHAQVPTTWDHYKVYNATPNHMVPIPPVVLADQFQTTTHNVQFLDYFMPPTEKHLLPPPGSFLINEPALHYSWWRISPSTFGALVAAQNQFGDQTLNVTEAEYLLNPTLKNQTGAPPVRNHYKCYRCTGQPINRDVRLIDQFDTWQTPVLFPRYLCNPTAKQIQGQPPHPIVDATRHYICYDIQPDPALFPASITDQFVNNVPIELQPGIMLCVPTRKLGVTATTQDTWGKLKMMYR
jgi:hypothetical protein